MKKAKAIAVAYALAVILTFGHAANNQRIAEDNAKTGHFISLTSSLAWPFYWSWELQAGR